MLLGESSGGLADADLDCKEARAAAGRFLAPTLTSGRETVPHSHWWYVARGLKTRTIKDIDGETLLVQVQTSW